MTNTRCTIQRRADGVLLVRVHSRDSSLPDAVFTFRAGDPQFERWQREYQAQEQTGHAVSQ